MSTVESYGVGVENARTVEVGSDQYHEIDAVSNSMLKLFADDPETCWQRNVARIADQKTSKAFDFGRRLERLVMFDEEPLTIPLDVLQKRRKPGSTTEYTYARAGQPYTDWLQQMQSQHGALLDIVTDEERVALITARERLREHKQANRLLWGAGQAHVSLLWDDVTQGPAIPCKCQLDFLHSRDIIVDLKTAAPSNIASEWKLRTHMWEFRYHWQAYWYRHAVKALTGKLMPFVFVFVQSDEPFRAFVVQPNDEWFEFAEFQVRKTFAKVANVWASRHDTVWRADDWDAIKIVGPPRYAQAALEDEL